MWDAFSDLSLLPFSIPILVLQAAHPDIGAAVGRYSVYKEEPWSRFFRTAFSLMRFVHGGRGGKLAREEAKTLRRLHADIQGERPDGSRYHALDPASFRVVPDTFLAGILRFRDQVGEPLTQAEREQLFAEYLQLCELFHIPRSALEPDLEAFERHFEHLLLETMTYNPTVAYLLEDMMRKGPPVPYLPLPSSWSQWIYRHTFYPPIRLFTVGFLDPRFREKHRIAWSERDEKNYHRWLKIIRWMRGLVPRPLRYSPFALVIMAGGRGPGPISPERLHQ